MEFEQFLELINRKKQTIAIVTILFVLFSVIFTFVQPLKFSAESKVLVMQSLPEGIDPYQVSKSNEHVASLLTQIISTNSFYKEVLNAGYNINKDYFPTSGNKQMKLWKKTVRASSDPNGIITIRTYHNNRVQVNEISEAVNYILETKHTAYHGFGEAVSVKIIEQPVTSDLPVKPNIFINMGVAFGFGILISLTYIYLFPQKRYNLRILPNADRDMASSDIEPGKDEFEIRVMKEQKESEENIYRQNLNNINFGYQERQASMPEYHVQNNESPVYEKPERVAGPPPDLPIVDEATESEEENNFLNAVPNRQPYEVEKRGSMENIIKRPGQRV